MKSLKQERVETWVHRLEIVFKYMFLTICFLSFNNLTAHHPLLTPFSYLVVALGAVLILYRLLHFQNYRKTFGLVFLIGFVLMYGITAVLRYEFGLMENIQSICWICLQMFLMYAFDYTQPKQEMQRTYFGLLKYFMVYIFVCNVVSIGMLLVGFGRTKATSPNGNLMGFLWGRLFGVYSDGNYGAVLCVASIFVSAYYILSKKECWIRVLNGISIAAALLFIVFSDSRTAMVCLLLSAFVFVYFILRTNDRLEARMAPVLHQIVCLLAALAIGLASVAMIPIIKEGYNAGAELVYKWGNKNDILQGHLEEEDNPLDEGPNTIGRPENELKGDISNRRFDLWGSSVEIWKEKPVFGVGHRTIQPFAEKYLPDTYLLNNSKGTKFDTSHNLFLDILAAQGVAGLLCFLAFMISVMVVVCKKMLFAAKNNCRTLENILYVTLLVDIAASSMFVLDIIYVVTAGAFIFWMTLSSLMQNLKYSEED